jgi:hypothetical protein
MQIKIEIDADNLKARTTKEARNLAYSVAQALNDTAKDVQYRVQGDVRQAFHLRKTPGSKSWAGAKSEFAEKFGDQPSRSETSWLVRQIAVLAWANVKKLTAYAEVGIRQRERLLLAKYDASAANTIREPFTPGAKNVAVPITRNTRQGGIITGTVEKAKRFGALKFKTMHTKSGKRQIKGKLRTFILSATATHPQGGVYQRVSSPRRAQSSFTHGGARTKGQKTAPRPIADTGIRLLYSFRRAFRLRKVFNLIQRAKSVYAQQFRENFFRRFHHLQR